MKKRGILFLVLILLLSSLPGGSWAGMFFSDVPDTAWYYGDVQRAVDMGLVNGKAPGLFGSGDPLKYSEAVKLAACMHQRATTGRVTLTPGKPWYQTYVDYCKDHGIISMDYNWTASATRAGYMQIFAYALPEGNYAPINSVPDNGVPDVPMTHPNAPAIYKLYRAGIVHGNDKQGTCAPNTFIRRSEVAAILTRMMVPSTRKSGFSGGGETASSAMTISVEPTDVTIQPGDNTSFKVTVTGGKAPYRYRWEKWDGTAWNQALDMGLAGQATEQLSLTNVTANHWDSNGYPLYKYRCIITDSTGATITTREVHTYKSGVTPPSSDGGSPLGISVQPVSVTAGVGGTVSFTIGASGGKTPYGYRWERWNGKGWAPAIDGGISGSSTATLTLSNLPSYHWDGAGSPIYQYRCTVTDNTGASVTSNQVTVYKAQGGGSGGGGGGGSTPLTIKTHPQTVTITSGNAGTFTVVPEGGTPPYTYNWYEVTAPTVDPTLPYTVKYTGKNLYVPTAGAYPWNSDGYSRYYYFCAVKDSGGNMAISNTARIYAVDKAGGGSSGGGGNPTPASPLVITKQPVNHTILSGDVANFTVAVGGGTPPYYYTWYGDPSDTILEGIIVGTAIYEGANATSLSVATAKPGYIWGADGYSKERYFCVIRDSLGKQVISKGAFAIARDKSGGGGSPSSGGSGGGDYQEMSISGPNNVFAYDHQNARFSVGVTGGEGPYTYQWQGNSGSGWIDLHGPEYDGEMEYQLIVKPDGTSWGPKRRDYRYRCKVTDKTGAVKYSGEAEILVY